VSSLFWPLYSRKAWAQPATVVAGTRGGKPFWPLFARLAWAHAATVVAGTIVEGAALASVRLIGVDTDSLCYGVHES
jgi:hypothetical protein